MTALWVSLLSIVSTSVGGLCALALRRRIDRLLGFTAGAVLGLVCFDLLPEILDLAGQGGTDPRLAIAALACGFVVVHGLQRPRARPHAGRPIEAGCAHDEHAVSHDPARGSLYAAALIAHSFVDGLGIGLAFQVSDVAGTAVAIAVIAHDFCDGANTVGLVLAGRGSTAVARRWLLADAVAPVAGAAASCVIVLPPQTLNLVLGLLAGSLLYVGVMGVLPRAVAAGVSRRFDGCASLAALVVLGAACAGAIRFVAT